MRGRWVAERTRDFWRFLAEHFKVPKSKITILRGTKARNETIQIALEGTARLLVE